jgi:hypothetical protein
MRYRIEVLAHYYIINTKIINENKNSDPVNGDLRFYTLMIKLHICCATSAGIERIFYVFCIIWIKLRNSLSPKESREKGPNLPRNLNKHMT